MALTKTTIFKGLPSIEGYYQVHSFKGSKKELSFVVIMKAERNTSRLQTQEYSTNFDINGENPIKQAYEYLKTLPEFKDAVDC